MSDSARRELTAAVLGAALAGGLALSAAGQGWAQVTQNRPVPLPPVTVALTGTDAAPLVSAAGLVLLAAGVALVAVRGAGRVVVGLFMAGTGGTLGWSGVRALAGGLTGAAAQVPRVGQGPDQVSVEVTAAWPVVVVLAGLLGVGTGLFVVLRGRHWPGMGRRYERPDAGRAADARAPRPQTDEDRAQAAWQALDRGEDPTVQAPSPAPGQRSDPGVS
ncbi:MAG: Trp biosynthesis associated, transrane protein Oprn/Chp [Blastococcus sp.]|nr:Trp biosynthesis associated, transrane protein Oprn/Chp [Blastococcus sp.]